MTRDGVAGLICLALSIGMLVLTRGLPQSPFVPIGPDFYPRIVLAIMAALSALLPAQDEKAWAEALAYFQTNSVSRDPVGNPGRRTISRPPRWSGGCRCRPRAA